jgi:NADH-quinone oxidoreductase subunit J
MLTASDYLFYVLALVSFFCGVGVVVTQNPIFSAFYLALTMVAIAGIFVTLNAFFIAGVQLIVYAGAVMVLFVMVLMLFDLKHEMKTFSKGLVANVFKLASCGVLLGMLLIYIWYSFSADPGFKPVATDANATMDVTKELSTALFTRYLFGFEAIGVLLLIIAVGTVTLSRIAGGTHADS